MALGRAAKARIMRPRFQYLYKQLEVDRFCTLVAFSCGSVEVWYVLVVDVCEYMFKPTLPSRLCDMLIVEMKCRLN